MKPKSRFVGILVLSSLVFFPSLASAQQEWDVNRYLQLVEESDALFQQAEVLSPDDPARQTLLMESVTAKQEAVEILTAGLLSGELDSLWDDALRDLLLLNENVVVILAELNQCITAEMHLNESLSEAILLTDEGAAHLESLSSEIDECNERVTAAQTREPTPVQPPPPPSSGPKVLPWVLIGAGGALGLVAIVWNLAGGDIDQLRTEYDEFISMCTHDPDGPPDCAAEPPATDLQEEINGLESDHTVQIILLAAGGVSLITGIVLLVVDNGDEEDADDLAWQIYPSFGPDSVGSFLQISF